MNGPTIQTILQQRGREFLAAHRRPVHVIAALRALTRCRTEAMGFHVRRCPAGHVCQLHYNACRHRMCPQCAWATTERWLQAEKERLLDCPHFHVVFTLPRELRALWRWNRRVFGNVLFRAAAESLLELLADPKYLGARPGLLLALHTWTQTLTLHPHIHALVTGGGWDAETGWRKTRDRWLLPGRVLMHKFRGKLRALLIEQLDRGELTVPHGSTDAQLRSLLNRLGRQTLNVRVMEQYRHGRGVATYLARYLRGGPLSNRRLLCFRNGQVTLGYRVRSDGDRRGVRAQLTLPVETFLARYVDHVPPPRFIAVRRYGLYATRCRDLLNAARRHWGQSEFTPQEETPSWQQLLATFDAAGPSTGRCPICHAPLLCERVPYSARPPPEAELWPQSA